MKRQIRLGRQSLPNAFRPTDCVAAMNPTFQKILRKKNIFGEGVATDNRVFWKKIKVFFCSVFSYKEKEDSFKVVSNFCQSANNLQTSKWSKFSVFAEKWLSAVRQVLLNNFAWNVTKLTTVADHKFSTFQHRFVRHLKAATKHFNQISSQGYSGPEKQATALKSPYTCCACCSKMLQLKPFAWADN